ncbi:MAG TPA: four helix bundle protein [Gammaproteobacteria bacterium]
MRKSTEFEDLVAWQKARKLSKRVYQITGQPPLSRDWSLCNQIRRAAVSVMANIAEGWDRSSRADTAHFLSIAKASCAELRSHFYVALDAESLPREVFDDLQRSASEIGRMIAGLRKAILRNSS